MKTELPRITAIATTTAIILAILLQSGFLSNIQTQIADNLYGGRAALDNIIIIAIDDKSISEIGRWPWSRKTFTQTLPKLNQSKAIGIDVAFFEAEDETTDKELGKVITQLGNVVVPAEYSEFSTIAGKVYGENPLITINEIGQNATLAYINVITDEDGKTRALNPNIQGRYKSFAQSVLEKWGQTKERKENRLLINYIGPTGSYKQYSFSDVKEGRIEAEEFKNKIVLIGATAPDLHDEVLAPNSAKPMPGIEAHANIIQMMITNRYLHKESNAATITKIFITAIITALAAYYAPVWASLAASILAMILYGFAAVLMFNNGTIINILYVPLTLTSSYMATAIYHYLHEKKQRKQVLGAFEKYVSKEVIKHIMEKPERLKLGGERREITVFFSDIRGFTTISETLQPEQLVNLLNEYLTEMTNIILKNNGVVDKYMGDAIMAFWGAPIDEPRHAQKACQAAIEMEQKLKELQHKWEKEGIPKIEIGIGLNTGPAAVGNMGSDQRFDYTAMGDTVNTASRLEGLNKQYGTRILISKSTRDRTSVPTRKLDAVKVKGKKEPVIIYELCEKRRNTIKTFEKGLGLYFKQKWDGAIKEFKKVQDEPSKIFIQRCEHFKQHPPGKDWDGAWVMETK